MGQKMRVVIIEPDKPVHIAEIENSLASMQATVGGYIEIVPAEWMPGGAILRNRNLLLVMNEEGKLEDLEPNFPLQNGSDYLFGTAIVLIPLLNQAYCPECGKTVLARMQNYEEDRPIAARREQFWLEYFGIEGVQ